MGTPFKMKGSPYPKLDVEINGVVHTGEDAYAKGRKAEAKKDAAWNEGSMAGQSDEALAQNARVNKAQTTSIKYTGDDAHKRIKESPELNNKETNAAHKTVREGGSYDQ